GFSQQRIEFLRQREARSRDSLLEQLLRECRRVRGRQAGVVENNDGGSRFLRRERFCKEKESGRKDKGQVLWHVHLKPDPSKKYRFCRHFITRHLGLAYLLRFSKRAKCVIILRPNSLPFLCAAARMDVTFDGKRIC